MLNIFRVKLLVIPIKITVCNLLSKKDLIYMSDNSYIERFFGMYPILLLLFVLGALSLTFIMKLQTIYNYTIILSVVVAASILFLFFAKNLSFELGELHIFSLNQNLLIKLYFIIFSWSLIYLVLTNNRSEIYIFSLSLLYLIIFLQLFSGKTSCSIILIEIATSMLNFIYGVTFVYPLYFGTTDILPHIRLARIIAESGRLLPESMFLYSKFPLYHLLVAVSSHITNLDVTSSLFLVTAPVFVIVLLFIYKLFYLVSNNKQISLLSCLVYSWSSTILFHGTYMVTRVLAFVFFVILFYLHYRINTSHTATNIYFKFFIILFTLSIVLAHQVSAAQIGILFIMFLIIEYLSHDHGYMSTTSVVYFNVFFISYWIYWAYDFTSEVIGQRLRSLIANNLIIQYNVNSISQNDNLLNLLFSNLDIYISLFFALIGVKYLVLYQRSKFKAAFGIFSLACFMFYFPSPLKLFWNTMDLLQFDRLTLFVFPFISLSIGVGIYIVIKSLFNNKYRTLCCIAIFLIPLFFSFVSIINSNTNSNFLYDSGPRSYFIQPEIDGFNYLDRYASSESYVFSDYFSQRYLRALTSKNYLCFNHLNSSEVKYSTNYSRGYFYIRDEAFETEGLYFGIPGTKEIYDFSLSEYQNNSNNEMFLNNKIYSNTYANLYFYHSYTDSQNQSIDLDPYESEDDYELF